jgi:hypothetical protein
MHRGSTPLRTTNTDEGDHPGAHWKSQPHSVTACARPGGDSAHPSSGSRVAVQDDITIWTRLGKHLPQLLDDPLRSRVSSRVGVQNPAPPMLDDKEAVERLEGQLWHGEEEFWRKASQRLPGSPPPIEPEHGAVPADRSLGLYRVLTTHRCASRYWTRKVSLDPAPQAAACGAGPPDPLRGSR